MIIWSGLGFLVFVFVFTSSLLFQLITNYLLGKDYWEQHKWPLGLSLLVAAAASWYLGNFLGGRKSRVLIDKQTGKEVVLRNKHALFFIDMKWWGPILGVIGFAVIVFNFAKY